MEQYVTLQNQSLKTENITEGMQKIEDLLDKVIIAFQRQLDALFEADVVDITADIRVMEQMMASEGLTNKKGFCINGTNRYRRNRLWTNTFPSSP